MYKIKILSKAKRDIAESAKWYNEKSDGLGEKFKIAVIEGIDKLKSDFIEYGTVCTRD